MVEFAIAVHGGAGNFDWDALMPEKQNMYRAGLNEALTAGLKILENGGDSLTAVEAVVVAMEDCPLFNAARGAVLNSKGNIEMDAAIMCGKTLKAGAVAGISKVKNPVRLASAIMKTTQHVFLIGEGAEDFAHKMSLEFGERDYFMVESRLKQWEKAKEQNTTVLDHSWNSDKKHGTVGAVALDRFGNLAAATSTGGMTNKMPGRVGDSPIIGAGTYANNASCAVSCTGHGEHFIRNVVAYDIHCLMEYKNMSLTEAANFVIHNKLKQQQAEGGLIAVDKYGNISMPYNTRYMFCASFKG